MNVQYGKNVQSGVNDKTSQNETRLNFQSD